MAENKYTPTKRVPPTKTETTVSLVTEVFRSIIMDNLILEPKLLSEMDSRELITKEESEEILNVLKQKNMADAVCLLLSKIGHDQSSERKFFRCLKESDDRGNQDIARNIVDEIPLPSHDESHQRVCNVIKLNLASLIGTIKPVDMLDRLASLVSDADQQMIRCKDNNEGNRYAALVLLNHLRRSPSGWPSVFIEAFEELGYDEDLCAILKEAHSSSNQECPKKVKKMDAEDDVECFSGGHKEITSAGDLRSNPSSMWPTPDRFEPSEEPLKEVVDEMETGGITEMTRASNLTIPQNQQGTKSPAPPDLLADVKVSTPPDPDQDGNTAPSRSEQFYDTLRQYQKTLAGPALEKLNTVLVSPTGTGKTHVAAYIIDQHLKELDKIKKTGKVVFIVPNIRLAHQQRDKLDELIGSSSRVIKCVVGDNIDVGSSLRSIMNADNVCITVMTAQILLNALQERREENRVGWNDITLFVADECHNTQKDHSYNNIMKQYLRWKMGVAGTDTSVPQVVGMTATLGTGGKGTTEDAMKHIFHICANLDAHVIQPVAQDQDLLTYLHIPSDIGPIILNPRIRDAFRGVLELIMLTIEQKITAIESIYKDVCMGVSDVVRQCPRDHPNYETWIAETKKKCSEGRDRYKDDHYQSLIAYLDNLKVYQQALCIHRDVRPKNAVRHLEDAMKDLAFRSGQTNDELIRLFEDFRGKLDDAMAKTEENPLLRWIKEKLVAKFTSNPGSGVLLFTRTRSYTKALLEWLKEEEAFRDLDLNPARVTGAQDPDMTKSEGDAILADFRLRKHKIIVATNVLEEGIDLRACNLVIRHNYVPSETGHTQVKGRGRAKNSESFLVALTATGRDFKQQELENKTREKWAREILEKISNLSQELIKREIRQIQNENWRKIWLKEQSGNSEEDREDSSEWRLLCKNCPVDVCSSSDVVRFRENKYVVTARDFMDKCQITRMKTPNFIKSNESINGKIYCAKCRHDWGAWCTYESQHLPIIKIDGFSIKHVSTEVVKTCKKWKKVPFKVRDVQDIEMVYDINDASLFSVD